MSETTTTLLPDHDSEGSPDKRPRVEWRDVGRKVTNSTTVTTILAIFLALFISALLIIAVDSEVQRTAHYLGARPWDFFHAVGASVGNAYSSLFTGAVVDFSATTTAGFFEPLTNTISFAVPLIFAGLALGMGFRAGLFNIGAQGQIILGAIFCGWIGFTFHLPPALHLLLCLIGAFLGGAIWGFIPGILKAKTGANEVIVTIMLNSIALLLLGWLLGNRDDLFHFRSPGSIYPVSPRVNSSAQFPQLFGSNIDLGFLLVLIAAVGVWWLMERSTLGFRIRAVGENPDAGRTAGMNVAASYVWVMVIGGGLAGLAATSQLLSLGSPTLNGDIAATLGFDAITVALLGRSRPLGTVLAGLLFGGLRAGSYVMRTATKTPVDIILILQSIIVLLIAAPPLVRAIFHLPDPERRRKRQIRKQQRDLKQEEQQLEATPLLTYDPENIQQEYPPLEYPPSEEPTTSADTKRHKKKPTKKVLKSPTFGEPKDSAPPTTSDKEVTS
ncbi:MAG: ABC transporter permease [Propionibacteriaceae bacterium]|nr:ABC transporter permease [Propionibacteriaceae bacterium]